MLIPSIKNLNKFNIFLVLKSKIKKKKKMIMSVRSKMNQFKNKTIYYLFLNKE